jgi:hypothetical protein
MTNTAKIRELNDALRKTFKGGLVQMTGGIANRPDRNIILDAVKLFDDWCPENDPYEEHDWFNFIIPSKDNIGKHPDDVCQDSVCVVKIDAYDADSMEFGSPDPSDPNVTFRVMTIMLASEY